MTSLLKEKETLLREVHHRIRNNLQIISSLLNLQQYNSSSKPTNDIFDDCQKRIQVMSQIHGFLCNSKSLTTLNMSSYINDLVSNISLYPGLVSQNAEISVDAQDCEMGIDVAMPCGLIINELVTNSLKHAFTGEKRLHDNGKDIIKVEFKGTGENVYTISVIDNGIGLPENFNPEAGSTTGMLLVNALTDQLHGKMEIFDTPGTHIKITFRS